LAETTAKKRTRRVNKVARAVVGVSLEEIRKKASVKPEVRAAQRDAALKEIKARKAANKDKKAGRGQQARATGAGQRTKMPKNVKR
jgi:hypothetical protein